MNTNLLVFLVHIQLCPMVNGNNITWIPKFPIYPHMQTYFQSQDQQFTKLYTITMCNYVCNILITHALLFVNSGLLMQCVCTHVMCKCINGVNFNVLLQLGRNCLLLGSVLENERILTKFLDCGADVNANAHVRIYKNMYVHSYMYHVAQLYYISVFHVRS